MATRQILKLWASNHARSHEFVWPHGPNCTSNLVAGYLPVTAEIRAQFLAGVSFAEIKAKSMVENMDGRKVFNHPKVVPVAPVNNQARAMCSGTNHEPFHQAHPLSLKSFHLRVG